MDMDRFMSATSATRDSMLRAQRIERNQRPEWDVMRVPCRGPCWNGVWFVFEKRGHDAGPYLLNAAGNPKRFRSEDAARKAADKLNRGTT
jgi:hypothetical protein